MYGGIPDWIRGSAGGERHRVGAISGPRFVPFQFCPGSALLVFLGRRKPGLSLGALRSTSVSLLTEWLTWGRPWDMLRFRSCIHGDHRITGVLFRVT